MPRRIAVSRAFARRPSPAMVAASLALFVALGGTGYAAATLARNSVGSPQLKKDAVVSSKVRNGSLTPADFRAGALPAGARGATGAQGPKGDAGAAGAVGAAGPKGDQGATGGQGLKGDRGPEGPQGQTGQTGPPGPFPDTLPQGKTVKGAWATSGVATAGGQMAMDDISWNWRFAQEYALNIVTANPSTDANCPGTVANPSAAPGYVCIYQRAAHNSSGFTYSVMGLAYRMGLPYWITASAPGAFDADGSWAVTGN